MDKSTIITLVIGLVIGVGGTLGVTAATRNDDSKQTITTGRQTSINDHSSMTMLDMNKQLEKLSGDEFDKTFIEMMTLHHGGAVAMAKLADTRANHSQIKQLSKAIVSAQEKEISEMKQWQMDWGYTNSENSMPGMSH